MMVNMDVDGYTHTRNQWFSTAVLRTACGHQAPFVRLSAVFNKTSNNICNRLLSAIK